MFLIYTLVNHISITTAAGDIYYIIYIYHISIATAAGYIYYIVYADIILVLLLLVIFII